MSNLIPVLDVMNGQVVRAIGGRRSEYRPIRSVLTDSCEPLEVAQALIAATRADTIYVADLDGITTGTASRGLVDRLANLPVRLLLDSGIRKAADAADDDRITHVLGTETLVGPQVIEEFRTRCDLTSVALSVDLFEGGLLGNWKAWGLSSDRAILELLEQAIGTLGVSEVILLDLAHVGGAHGTGTEERLAESVRAFPGVRFFAGGGVGGWDDVRRLESAGAAGVLVSSAIHAGIIRSP